VQVVSDVRGRRRAAGGGGVAARPEAETEVAADDPYERDFHGWAESGRRPWRGPGGPISWTSTASRRSWRP
ncbi:MAG TPA: hypothetical protein VFG47_21875, partial [Geminicoccaceae bacterium]|nr:hypothetical protein [Geminicoccaceae bacterium]